ncbi:putative zinc-binding protein [Sphaerimonospora mesophila]|uniref:putative zinc-binding protein n=1 Tax=Sphaerimonospora mesophila TaxID=37483 RepID=UPI0007C69D5A
MARPNRASLPLVYSCSGCSSAAQMANDLALRLDRMGLAEMSCIAGVGGDVPSLVRVATSGRPILALDGCPLMCVRATLKRHDVVPDEHVLLNTYGVAKRKHLDYDPEQAETVLASIVDAARRLAAPDHADDERDAVRGHSAALRVAPRSG